LRNHHLTNRSIAHSSQPSCWARDDARTAVLVPPPSPLRALPDLTDLVSPNPLRHLSAAQCLDLLATGWVGRVGVTVEALPVILPVNYVVCDEVVLFRDGGRHQARCRSPRHGDRVPSRLLRFGRNRALERAPHRQSERDQRSSRRRTGQGRSDDPPSPALADGCITSTSEPRRSRGADSGRSIRALRTTPISAPTCPPVPFLATRWEASIASTCPVSKLQTRRVRPSRLTVVQVP